MSNFYEDGTPAPRDLRERLFDAHQRFERMHGRRAVTTTEIAKRLKAQRVATTPTSVGRWLAGAATPPNDTVRALAAVYGVSFAWLLVGAGDMLDLSADERAATSADPRLRVPPGGIPTAQGRVPPEVDAAMKRKKTRGGG